MARKDRWLHSTMLVTLVIILSKAVGFGRDMVTTAYFGRTMENDAYVSAYSLFYLPVLLFNSCISATLIPLFVEERERFSLKHSNRFASNAINLFALLALIVSAVMFALAEPILHLLYKNKAEGSEAAKMLMVMCVGIIFLSALQTLTGILQGVDKQMLPVKNLAIGAVGKLVITYVFVGIKAINVSGGPIGTIAAYAIAAVLNHRDLKKQLGIEIDYTETYVKPGICSVLMGVAAFAAYKLLYLLLKSNTLALLLAILVGVVVYGALVLLTGTIRKEEIRKLPKGEKLLKLLDRFVK